MSGAIRALVMELVEGVTLAERLLAAVLRSEVDWNRLPKQRLHDLGDARLEIEEALREPEPNEALEGGRKPQARWRRVLPWWVPLAAVLVAAALAAVRRPPAGRPRVSRLTLRLVPPPRNAGGLAMAPDGAYLAYVAKGQVHVRALDREDVRALPEARGERPFFSLMTAIALSALLAVNVAAQTWTPPVGIPAPSFGISEGCSTPNVVQVAAGALPPATIAAGQTVVLNGTRSGTLSIAFAGTSTSPACLTGAPGNNWSSGGFGATGSYGIIDGVVGTGGTQAGASGTYIAFRNVSLTGTLSQTRVAGIQITNAQDVVIYKTLVTRFGNVAASGDEDANGISIGRGVARVWILDSESSYHSGDGITTNPYPYNDAGLYNGTRFIYIGRNNLHHNKQSCGWSKGSQDIIWSQNQCHDIVPSGSSYGQGLGFQYESQRVWFIRNNIYNSAVGIGTSGDQDAPGQPASVDTYIVDNTFNAISGQGDGSGAWAGGAIFLSADSARSHVANNTATNSPRGIQVPRGLEVRVAGNIGLPIVSDRPVVNTTAEAVYATFQSLYGLSIRPGPAPKPTPTPTPVPTPTPTLVPTPVPPVVLQNTCGARVQFAVQPDGSLRLTMPFSGATVCCRRSGVGRVRGEAGTRAPSGAVVDHSAGSLIAPGSASPAPVIPRRPGPSPSAGSGTR